MNFPQFDGEDAQFWITCATNYFEMYSVESPMWVRVTTMHFMGLASVDWTAFCAMIHECFSRDQHELLIRQLFHIRQTSPVQDYVDRFTALVDQLKSYNKNLDALSITCRFVDGLQLDIRVVVLVARPSTLDAACTLALLQEEAADQGVAREPKRLDASSFWASSSLSHSLPAPPPRIPGAPAAVDKKPGDEKKPWAPGTSMDNKLSTLQAYRKARGLCIHCVEKWAPGHKCATTLQLHVL